MTGLYYLRARYYDPAVGRFINEDTYEGQVNNPLSLNLYTYCYNSPTNYVDPTGNSPLAIVSVILKIVDYGWTAWDIRSDIITILNPGASFGQKFLAVTDAVLSIGFEVAEPDDGTPLGLPADDAARKIIMKEINNAFADKGLEGVYNYLKAGFGASAAKNYIRSVASALGVDIEFHHLLPQAKEFKDFFKNAGLDVEDYLVPLEKS